MRHLCNWEPPDAEPRQPPKEVPLVGVLSGKWPEFSDRDWAAGREEVCAIQISKEPSENSGVANCQAQNF